jgi:hypothetical protein
VVAEIAEVLFSKDEAKLVIKAIEFIVRKEGRNLTKSEFDGLELNRLEDIAYDIRKQIHG